MVNQASLNQYNGLASYPVADKPYYYATAFGVHASNTDDTVALQAALNTVSRTGGTLSIPAGVSLVSAALTIAAGGQPFRIVGQGAASILRANASIAQGIFTFDGILDCIIEDITLDGNSLAANGLKLTIGIETSTRNKISNIRVINTTSYGFSVQGHEDSSLINCYTPGSPMLSTYFSVPSGAGRIIGGALFGQVTLEYQQFIVDGCTLGPIFIVNTSANIDSSLSLDGCYIYDNSLHNCIDTNTNLTNITARGCWFIAQTNVAWINGNLVSNNSLLFDCCSFTQAAGNGNTSVNITQTSGSGFVRYTGCAATLNSGVTTVKAYFAIGGATTTATQVTAISSNKTIS